MVSGNAGTGKTSIAATFVDAACRRKEKCLYFAFEESQDQILRNMRSIGLGLEQWIERGLPPLHFLVEPRTLERLADRKVFVAELKGEVVGFLVASPVPVRNGTDTGPLTGCAGTVARFSPSPPPHARPDRSRPLPPGGGVRTSLQRPDLGRGVQREAPRRGGGALHPRGGVAPVPRLRGDRL